MSLQSYSFKTPPYDCQREALERSWDRESFALLMEQGTGKSKVVIDNAALLFNLGRINALVVVAPNGVHRNWVTQQVAEHLPDYIPRACAWWASSPRKSEKEALEHLFDVMPPTLRVLTVNFESVPTPRAFDYLKKFLQVFDCMLVVDEAHRMKNPSSAVARSLKKLRRLTRYRRILTGTPVSQAPLDVFAPFEFLDPTILGFSTFASFRSEYAEVMESNHPLVRRIQERTGAKFAPVLIATDDNGRPKYRNLKRLSDKLSPHVFRVRKADCLDLPPKIYVQREFEVTAEHRALFRRIVDKSKAQDLTVENASRPISRLNVIGYLQQALSGIVPLPLREELGCDHLYPKPLSNPRIKVLLDELEGSDESTIIWAVYTRDIEDITAALSSEFGPDSVVQYYGAVSQDDRSEAERRFQNKSARFFVGNAAAGGTGLTLTAATTSIYYGNTFRLVDRLQSEDRCHRIGQRADSVRYVDIIAPGTIDTKILQAFRDKKDVADAITGDAYEEWIKL